MQFLADVRLDSARNAADSSERWNVPLGGGFGSLVRFGKTPVDLKGQLFYNVEAPENVGDWSFQVQVKLLFPK